MIAGASESSNLDSTDLTEEELQELLVQLPKIIKELEEFKAEK
ncbi:hypothetical protein [Sporomusa sp.]|nr:hypothetical protein [Sporomusa sp.]HWR09364.1 hypothetical protein [Sporomusa sp.]